VATGGLGERLADERNGEKEPAEGIASPLLVSAMFLYGQVLTYSIRVLPGPRQAVVNSTNGYCGRSRRLHGRIRPARYCHGLSSTIRVKLLH
jgi:hypothetical protein